MGTIIFDGKDLAEFGLVPTGSGTYGAPARKYNATEIQGRNGDFIQDLGYFSNCNVTYPCYISECFAERMQSLRNFLCSRSGYCRLQDSYDPDHFRMAYFSAEIVPETATRNMGARFELTFTCKPQRYLLRGFETVSGFTSVNEIEKKASTYFSTFTRENALQILSDDVTKISYNVFDLGEKLKAEENYRFDFVFYENETTAGRSGDVSSAIAVSDDPATATGLIIQNPVKVLYPWNGQPPRRNIERYIITPAGFCMIIYKTDIRTGEKTVHYKSTSADLTYINNETLFDAKPIIRIKRKTVTQTDTKVIAIINDKAIRMTKGSGSNGEVVTIDGETMNAYVSVEDSVDGRMRNFNPYIILDDVTLKPGQNLVMFTNAVEDMEIIPRWYEV